MKYDLILSNVKTRMLDQEVDFLEQKLLEIKLKANAEKSVLVDKVENLLTQKLGFDAEGLLRLARHKYGTDNPLLRSCGILKPNMSDEDAVATITNLIDKNILVRGIQWMDDEDYIHNLDVGTQELLLQDMDFDPILGVEVSEEYVKDHLIDCYENTDYFMKLVEDCIKKVNED